MIGIAVAGAGGIHLERANQLARLRCVFADQSVVAILAAEANLNAIESDLLNRSIAALTDFKPLFSGVALGDIREAEGLSLQQIGASWMAAMSSLYDRRSVLQLVERGDFDLDAAANRETADRLPALVLDYIKGKRPGLDRCFSEDIRESRHRRRNAHGVIIDFAGSRFVANFGTLAASKLTASVGRIKMRLWDLKVDRDGEQEGLAEREHEMIVQYPKRNDPQLTANQVERMEEALNELEKQADQEQLRLRPLNTVEEIGEHILRKEAA
ncbi:hypothetical protein [Methylosinus sporium]|uniref:hypothetical protein n=1 Tax=Methylosinus sporium TaxID=428 RepID=UPI0011B240CB|nr:hypothetical protein [Methylosinus sporium]